MFPNSCSSLNPQSLKRHTPRNQASVLPWQLAQIPLTDPAKGTLPRSGTPFSNLKASTGQDSPSGFAPSPTLSGPRPGGLHSPLHRAIQKSSSENMARARAAPRPPTARASKAAPHSGGLRETKNGKSRSEWSPFPRGLKKKKKKKAKNPRGVLCLRFQQFRFPSTAPGRRIPSGHKESTGGFDLGRAGSASASRGGLSVLGPGQRPGRPRRARAERRGSPDGTSRRLPSSPEGMPRRAARRARMEREPLAAAPSPSPRRAGAPGPRELRRRGAEPDTHPAPGSATPSVPPRRLRAPHLLLPPGKGGGLVGEEEEGAGGASPLPAPLRPLQAQRSPPFPSGLGSCPAPGLAACGPRHPLDPRQALIAGGLEVHGPTPAPGAGGSGN